MAIIYCHCVMEFTSGGISEMYKNKCFLKCNFLMEWKGLKVYIQSAKLGGSLMPEACKIIHERIKWVIPEARRACEKSQIVIVCRYLVYCSPFSVAAKSMQKMIR